MKWHIYPEEKPEAHEQCLCRRNLCRDIISYQVYEYFQFSSNSTRCWINDDGYPLEFKNIEWISINDIEKEILPC